MPHRRPRSHCPCIAAPLLALTLAGLPATALAGDCPAPGQWQRDGEVIDTATLMTDLAERRVVLLGEQHERLAHHRWQLHTLAGLHAREPQMAIGLEMLPRKAQPALDAWVAGELDEAAFLAESDWLGAWGYDPDAYLPILHFARMQRIPLRALNVTPALRQRIAEEGWEAIPLQERHAITPPIPASEGYREVLAEVYANHPSAEDPEAGLERFIDAQLVWDRAMAQGLAEATEEAALVVGLMGQGHVSYGHGVPHQLADLGIDAAGLLAWQRNDDCTPPAGMADALFTLGDEAAFEPPEPQRLGILVAADENGVRVVGVGEESLAEALGLAEGDLIVEAGGRALNRPGELTDLVRRQTPGTLLPLTVTRNGSTEELLARFPLRDGVR
ncbi:MAG: ChaN family lipoprotein [Halomonas sp.]|uniref:ChaN family lipoprotein n=1 Tax=Halomonas sp. TaxID=1486246 RepID=UPI001A090F23|nr:ChaN family lipoprotein [Halomonas sp.]MBE0488861.1 ChaN family lipoprotein [Halomonas sp.]